MATLNSGLRNAVAGAALMSLISLAASAQTAPNQVVAGGSSQQNTGNAHKFLHPGFLIFFFFSNQHAC